MASGSRWARAPTDVLRLVIGQALTPVIVGLAIGLGAALAATQMLTAQLYGVGPRDPITMASVSVGFVAVAVAGQLDAGAAGRRGRSDPRAQSGMSGRDGPAVGPSLSARTEAEPGQANRRELLR